MDQNKSHTKTMSTAIGSFLKLDFPKHFLLDLIPNNLKPHRSKWNLDASLPTRRHCFYREPTEITDYTCPTSDKHFITAAKPSFPLIKGLQLRSKLYKLIFLHSITLSRNTVSILFSIWYTILFSNYNPSIIKSTIHS